MQYRKWKKCPFFVKLFSLVYSTKVYKKYEVERCHLISLYLCQWVPEPHLCQVSVLLEFIWCLRYKVYDSFISKYSTGRSCKYSLLQKVPGWGEDWSCLKVTWWESLRCHQSAIMRQTLWRQDPNNAWHSWAQSK